MQHHDYKDSCSFDRVVETVEGNDAGSIIGPAVAGIDDKSILELATVSNDDRSILGLAVVGR